ncbi:hypothetical protein BT67DRAFT_227045 [Trichocladium antarcticum]|uniref:Uncharacterized protein n=1 Tax=Trichocladium antarcticum TaxID=1450529 RepID=A0AAN6ZAJ1_9PEZI|nr:hypothetical protein BT67DRAFT_227045 [Trichocladium antarcticum]
MRPLVGPVSRSSCLLIRSPRQHPQYLSTAPFCSSFVGSGGFLVLGPSAVVSSPSSTTLGRSVAGKHMVAGAVRSCWLAGCLPSSHLEDRSCLPDSLAEASAACYLPVCLLFGWLHTSWWWELGNAEPPGWLYWVVALSSVEVGPGGRSSSIRSMPAVVCLSGVLFVYLPLGPSRQHIALCGLCVLVGYNSFCDLVFPPALGGWVFLFRILPLEGCPPAPLRTAVFGKQPRLNSPWFLVRLQSARSFGVLIPSPGWVRSQYISSRTLLLPACLALLAPGHRSNLSCS